MKKTIFFCFYDVFSQLFPIFVPIIKDVRVYVHETVESLIKQAESLNAGESSLAWDYNVD